MIYAKNVRLSLALLTGLEALLVKVRGSNLDSCSSDGAAARMPCRGARNSSGDDGAPSQPQRHGSHGSSLVRFGYARWGFRALNAELGLGIRYLTLRDTRCSWDSSSTFGAPGRGLRRVFNLDTPMAGSRAERHARRVASVATAPPAVRPRGRPRGGAAP